MKFLDIMIDGATKITKVHNSLIANQIINFV